MSCPKGAQTIAIKMEGSNNPVKFTVASWNSTGSNTVKMNYFYKYCLENNIVCGNLQETFKTGNSNYFSKLFKEYSCSAKNAIRQINQSQGRGSGGLIQIANRKTVASNSVVNIDNYRIQAQLIHVQNRVILCMNAYFPTDSRTSNIDILKSLLEDIEVIIEKNNFTDFIMAGDLNCDLSRNTAHVNHIRSWLTKMDLLSVWSIYPIDFTFLSNDLKTSSCLDHFIVSSNTLDIVEGAGVHHSGDSLSGHDIIWLSLSLEMTVKESKTSTSNYSRPCWDKATEWNKENFRINLSTRLESITIPDGICCNDICCKDPSHKEQIDTFTLDILTALVETSYTCIPMPVKSSILKKRKWQNLPSWKEEVEPLRKQSILYHLQWIREGKMTSGWLYETMIRKRKDYHKAVKNCISKEKKRRSEKMMDAVRSKDGEIFKLMKNVRKKVADDLSDEVNYATNEPDIAEVFKSSWERLYNSVDYGNKLEQLKAELLDEVDDTSENAMNEIDLICTNSVEETANNMKENKVDYSGGFNSEAIKNGGPVLFKLLASLFKSWMRHLYIPGFLLRFSMTPLLKNSLKNRKKVESYRAIVGTSLIMKLLESLVVRLWGCRIPCDSLQFGFTKNTGTSQCSWLLHEIMKHFKSSISGMWVITLDCTSAFDVCRWDKLLLGLRGHLPPIVLLLVLTCFQFQKAWVNWGGASSSLMEIRNGSGQGKVWSPLWWSVYLLPLLHELRKSGTGCHIGGVFLGFLAYADDLVLLAPSRSSAASLLSICEKWSLEFGVKFSTDPDVNKSKSKALLIGFSKKKKKMTVCLQLYGEELPIVSSFIHLGHLINDDASMTEDTRSKRMTYILKSVDLLETLPEACPEDLLHLNRLYCGDLYGSSIWDLKEKETNKLMNCWGVSVKDAFKLPRQTHKNIAESLVKMTTMREEIMARGVRFIRNILSSPSMEVRVVGRLLLNDVRSTIGSNLDTINKCVGGQSLIFSGGRIRDILSSKRLQCVDTEEISDLRMLLETRFQADVDIVPVMEEAERDGLDEIINAICVV